MNNNSSLQQDDQLIPIREHDGQHAVSGRDLHEFLEVGRDYPTWFKAMTAYGFMEDQDFTPIRGKTSELGGRPSIDHALTLDMAKEIAMIQRTEKGKQARQYFIECERRAQQVTQPRELSRLELIELARESEVGRLQVERQLEAVQPVVEYHDKYVMDNDDMVTVDFFASQYGTTGPTVRQLLMDKGIAVRKVIEERWSSSKQKKVKEYEWRARQGKRTSGWFSLRPHHKVQRYYNGQVRQTLYVKQAYALELAKVLGIADQQENKGIAA